MEQTKQNALGEDQYQVQQSKNDDGDHDMLQSNVKFASFKEQALSYGDRLFSTVAFLMMTQCITMMWMYGKEAQRNWRTL
jgi:hypothetical protein